MTVCKPVGPMLAAAAPVAPIAVRWRGALGICWACDSLVLPQVHMTSLLHGLAVQHLRGDWDLINLVPHDYAGAPPANVGGWEHVASCLKGMDNLVPYEHFGMQLTMVATPAAVTQHTQHSQGPRCCRMPCIWTSRPSSAICCTTCSSSGPARATARPSTSEHVSSCVGIALWWTCARARGCHLHHVRAQSWLHCRSMPVQVVA